MKLTLKRELSSAEKMKILLLTVSILILAHNSLSLQFYKQKKNLKSAIHGTSFYNSK